MATLRDKTVLITRQQDQSSEFVTEVERRGGRALVIPMIRIIDPDSWDSCDRALDRISSYDIIVFTSVNGVEKFFLRCGVRGVEIESFRSVDVFAVGRKTERAIVRKGLSVRFVPEEFSTDALARHFKAADFSRKKVLMPRGDRGREELEALLKRLGATTDPVEVYRNVEPEVRTGEDMRNRITRGEIDVVAFASPSAVVNFSKIIPFESLSMPPKRVLVAVIGPTTRDALFRHGYQADIMGKEATVEGLAEAIAKHFES